MHQERSSFFSGSFLTALVFGRPAALQIVLVTKAKGNGNVHKAYCYIAEITAAGIRVDHNKGCKGDQHDHIAGQQKYPVFQTGLLI